MLRFAACLLTFALAAQEYPLGPDHQRQTGVPQGQVTKHTWTSKIYPGTVRDYWVYVPAQYKPEKPAAVMVFQDGAGYVNEEGRWRTPIVFDNLIHKGQMPVTVGIFLNPGVAPAAVEGAQNRYNRSFEYDALGDRYAKFLWEEILPEVSKTVNLSTNPNDRAIAGLSSGAIAAFTVAWNRPDQFRRVLSFIGSYVNLRGGQIYPTLIRKTEPKPLRVFVQDGNRDLNIYSGNWWIANQDMASALDYANYDAKWVRGSEAHNAIHGSSIFPDALRWLWRDYPKPIEKNPPANDQHFLKFFIDPASDWEKVGEGYRFTEGPAVDRSGNVFFVDVPNNKILKIDHATRQITDFVTNTQGASGLMFGPDGRLYSCEGRGRRLMAYTADGKGTAIAEGLESCNDLAVNQRNEVYFTDPRGQRVWFVNAAGQKRIVAEGLEFPNGVRLSPDQGQLAVADYRGKWVWSYQVLPDGSLTNGQAFYRMETPDENGAALSDGMTFDTEGHLYVTTAVGVQVCDQPGRVVGILAKPQAGPLSNIVFAGPQLDWVYVTAGDKVFRRHSLRKGVTSWAPVKPPVPRL